MDKLKDNLTVVGVLAALGLGTVGNIRTPEIPEYTGPTAEEIVAHENRLSGIEAKLDVLASDRATMSKHWKLHNWARTQINVIQNKLDMTLEQWPDSL